jgi:RHS repeat-associated protein
VKYLRTLNIDEHLARIASNDTRYYLTDALGSTLALTDTNGAIKTQYNYTPFGNTELIGENSDNPFQYTGRENDGNNLYHYRLRYKLGPRFMSEDPIGFAGGDANLFAYMDNFGKALIDTNLYTYTFNNPVNYIDPEGEYATWVVITAAVVGGAITWEWIIYPLLHPEEPHEHEPHLECMPAHPVDPRTVAPQRLPKQPRQKPRLPRPYRPPVRR